MRKLFTFEEPRFLALIILITLSAGISALLTLGRQEDPTITNIYATIYAELPAGDPARVEALITTRIEAEIREIPEIASMFSVSFTGSSIISITLDETLDADRIEQVWISLRSKVAQAAQDFPPGAREPIVDTDIAGAYSAILAVKLTHPKTTLTAAANVANGLADRLRAIPNTRIVDLFGAPRQEVLVEVDPYDAAALGITVDEVAQAIARADGKVVAGRMLTAETATSIAVSGEIERLNRIRTIPLRNNSLSQNVQVADIATVMRGPADPPDALAIADGDAAILIAVRAEDGVQIDRWMTFVREEIAAATATAPVGTQVALLFDQSEYTIARLSGVGINLLLGMAIVVLVLIFTLGWRAATIVALVLPLVSLATLGTLSALGVPLHQMSVTGLIVSLGLVVDAAIVMTDTVRRRLASGLAPSTAVASAVNRLFAPLAASTITTILAFLPMIILPGPTGDFIGTIAISVAVMVLWSFVIAMLVTSALSGIFLSEQATPPMKAGGLVKLIVQNPVSAIGVSLILPFLGFALAADLTPQFFPAEERNQFHVSVELEGHASIQKTEKLAFAIDDFLGGIPGIRSRFWSIGESAPSFYYNLPGGRSNEPGFAQAMVTTDDPAATYRILETLQTELERSFPEALIVVNNLRQGPPVGAPIAFEIYGPDIATLRRLGEALQTILVQQEGVTQARAVVSLGRPQIRYHVDTFRAQVLGLDEISIARQLEAGLSGVTGGSLVEGTEQIPIRVRFSSAVRGSSTRISDLPFIATRGGQQSIVLLSSVAVPRLETSEAAILRFDGERMNVVEAFTRQDVLAEDVLERALAAIEESGLVIPEDYRLDFGGDREERSDVVRNILASIGLIATLTLATVVVAFRSFRLTLGTTIVAVLSAGLSCLAIALMQFPIGLNALFGMIGSIGVSVNTAIIVFTALQENDAARNGDLDAATAEVAGAGRHIFSTTLTTFGGFLPLLFADGLFWPPFAAAIAGGVLLSVTLAFLFTPAFFLLFYARRPGAAMLGRPS